MTISLEHRKQHLTHFSDVPIQPKVFKHVVFAQAIASCGCLIECTVSYDDVATAFDQEPKRVRAT